MFRIIGKVSVYSWAIVGLVFLFSCEKEEVKPTLPDETLTINNFIWENLKEVYLWEEFIPQNVFPEEEPDSKAFFEKLLFKPTDRWSFITEDYDALINSFKGIEESFGHNFKLFLIQETGNVIGVVKYVVPGSPADQAGIKRGDVFYKVNGITLTPGNYSELLFRNKSYTLSFGTYQENGVIEPLKDIPLTSVIISENPIYLSKTIEYEGYKIGYLAYNQFITEYNDSLVKVINTFRSDGISDLVLDLRYNPGGSISTAILLSSMIAPAAVSQNQEIYSRLIWNDFINDYFLEREGEESANLISRFVTPEVSLDLQTVYILVSSNTASASEMVINCLEPYMNVVVIGSENTTGKYVGSITIRADETEYENWAMQPIVLKTANANGISDYVNGIAPVHMVSDDFGAELGSLDENMLARAIELITGFVISEPARMAARPFPKTAKTIKTPFESKKEILNMDFQ